MARVGAVSVLDLTRQLRLALETLTILVLNPTSEMVVAH